mgnify:CR=1 FL=1
MANSKKKAETKKPINTLSNEYTGKLSIVIPLYNEMGRVERMKKSLNRFQQVWKTPCEIIFVNDGSSDATASYLKETYHNSTESMEYVVLNLAQNQGKGAALKAGVAKATGNHILTLDADMAASPVNLLRWLDQLPLHTFDDDSILIASREHLSSIIKKEDGSKRKVLGNAFNYFVQALTGLNQKDTQCGFKLYPAAIAKHLFGNMSTKGWAHDVELLHHAHLLGIAIEEMPIKWQEVAQSKVNVLSDGIKMGFASIGITLWNIIRFFFVFPFQEMKKKPAFLAAKNDPPIYRFLFAIASLSLFIIMPWLSFSYGITGDEGVQKDYGDLVLKYFEDASRVNDEALNYKNLYLYGGMFDYWAAWWHKYVFTSWDIYELRHFINALVGAVLILFTGLLARSVTQKWHIAFWAILFTVLYPRLFGHTMNNPKDIPFAAGYVMSLFFILNFVRRLPRPSANSVVGLIIGIAFTINTRVGGILVIPYLLLFTGGTLLIKPQLRPLLTKFGYLFKLAIVLGVVIVLGYFGGLIYWPFALEDPIGNPAIALAEMSNFSVGIRMIWQGEHYWSELLPWYYILKWLWIVTPLVTMIGFVLAIFPLIKDRKNSLFFLMLLFAAVFPIAYAIYKDSALYDGMRHFLFVTPIITITAAYGFVYTISFVAQKSNKFVGYVGYAMVLGLMASPMYWLVSSHPNQYTYFNEIAGGIDNAYGNYETDYWMNSTTEAADWAIENIPEIKAGKPVKIATQAYLPVHYRLQKYKNVKVVYTRYHERAKQDWDYGIYISRFANKGVLKQDAWPAGNEVLHTIYAGNTPLCMVTKRSETNKKSALAADAFKAQKYPEAIALMQEVVKDNPLDESSWLLLMQYGLQSGQFEIANQASAVLDDLIPEYSNSIGMKGIYYLQRNQIDSAEIEFRKTIAINVKYTFGAYHLARILATKNQLQESMKYLELFDKYGGNPQNGYDLAIDVAKGLNDQAKLNYFQAKKLSLQGKWREALPLLQRVLRMAPDYAPAVKMKRDYDNAVAVQKRKEARIKRLKKEGKIK